MKQAERNSGKGKAWRPFPHPHTTARLGSLASLFIWQYAVFPGASVKPIVYAKFRGQQRVLWGIRIYYRVHFGVKASNSAQ